MSREVRRFADTFKNLPAYTGLHFAEVVSIDASPAYTLTVRVDGETGASSNVSGVRYLAHCYPEPGSLVLLQRYGRDLIAVDTVAGKGGVVPTMRAHKTADQALTTTAATQVTYSTASFASDPWGMFDNANDEMVAPLAGYYLGTCDCAIGGITNPTTASVYLRHVTANGVTVLQTALARQIVTAASGNVWQTVADVYRMGVGERLRVVAQSSTTTASVVASAESNSFTLTYLGPDA